MNFKAISLCLGGALLACLPMAAQSYTFDNVQYKQNGTTDTFTQFLAINRSDIVAGYHGADVNKGFTYNLKTKIFTNENYPLSAQTQVTGINNSPFKTVGFYIDSTGRFHGFEARDGVFEKVDFPGQPFNQLLGQNNFAQAAGYFSTKIDGSGPDHAYIFDENGGVFEVLTIPGSTTAQATGINDASQVCGFFTDSNNVTHGWLLRQGSLLQLDYPDSTSTSAFGLNNNGIVVGTYTDVANNTHGFTYNTMTKKWVSVDDPDGVGTTIVNGINDAGLLVGFFGTAPDNTAFVATPTL
jgi:uncharacterized membrane protein